MRKHPLAALAHPRKIDYLRRLVYLYCGAQYALTVEWCTSQAMYERHARAHRAELVSRWVQMGFYWLDPFTRQYRLLAIRKGDDLFMV